MPFSYRTYGSEKGPTGEYVLCSYSSTYLPPTPGTILTNMYK